MPFAWCGFPSMQRIRMPVIVNGNNGRLNSVISPVVPAVVWPMISPRPYWRTIIKIVSPQLTVLASHKKVTGKSMWGDFAVRVSAPVRHVIFFWKGKQLIGTSVEGVLTSETIRCASTSSNWSEGRPRKSKQSPLTSGANSDKTLFSFTSDDAASI